MFTSLYVATVVINLLSCRRWNSAFKPPPSYLSAGNITISFWHSTPPNQEDLYRTLQNSLLASKWKGHKLLVKKMLAEFPCSYI